MHISKLQISRSADSESGPELAFSNGAWSNGILVTRTVLIDGLIARLRGPEPRSVVLHGPAGIGKSHTAAIVTAAIAERAGAVVHVAAGHAQQQLPFGAVLHLLDGDATPSGSTLELTQRVRSRLRRQRGGAPTVVWVDDIDALDGPSAALIENALLHGDIVVLATQRTTASGERREHHLSATLDAVADPVTVEPLPTARLVALLTEWFGPGEHGSTTRLAHLSGGNPMLLRELARAAQAQHAWSERDGLWHLDHFDLGGASLERLVGAHLDRLDADSWELVRTLAVAGSLARPLLERIDPAALARLERDGLVRGDPSWFAHPLYGEVLQGTTGRDDRHRLLSKLVTVIGPADQVSDARLGSWLLEIGDSIEPVMARRGAQEAINRWQNDLARRLLESIDEPTANDLTELQWSLANDGQTEAALRVADRAVAAATNDDGRAASGLARAELLLFQLGRRDEGLAQLVELRDGLTEPVQVRRVNGALALYAHVCGDRQLATEARRAAIADLDVTEMPDPIRVNALMASGIVPAFRGRVADARPTLLEGARLAAAVQSQPRVVRFRLALAMGEMRVGRLGSAMDIVGQELEAAAVTGGGPAHGAWLALAGFDALQRGDVVEAERFYRESIRVCEFVDDLAVIEHSRAELGSLLAEVGRRDDATALLVDLPDDHRGDLRGEGSRARGLVRLSAPAETDDFAVGMAEIMIAAGHDLWAPSILHEAARCGLAPRSAAMLRELVGEIDGPLVAAYADHAVGAVEHDVGLMIDAARALRAAGAVLSALDAEADIVDELKRAGRPGEAAQHLEAARTLLATLPDPDLLPVGHRLAAHAASVDVLTRRQREIVELVLAGSSSREVADQLFVSVRTVDNHLASVYRKLGVSGRAELQAALASEP